LNFLGSFATNPQKINLIKILSLGAKFFPYRQTDRQTDRQTNRQTDMKKLIVTFFKFGNAPRKQYSLKNEFLKSNGLCGILL